MSDPELRRYTRSKTYRISSWFSTALLLLYFFGPKAYATSFLVGAAIASAVGMAPVLMRIKREEFTRKLDPSNSADRAQLIASAIMVLAIVGFLVWNFARH